MSLAFKDLRTAGEWQDERLDATVRRIVLDAEDLAHGVGWETVTLTSIHRTPEENDALYGGKGDHLDGVHVEWRGVDIRTSDIHPLDLIHVQNGINALWLYDPERPALMCAVIEGDGIAVGSSAPHLHCQSHPNTVLREQYVPTASRPV
jgi:hypothetical protein